MAHKFQFLAGVPTPRMETLHFQNMRLNHIVAHKSFDILAVFGFRTCLIFNSSMEITQRYLDSSKSECFHCAAFIDPPKSPADSSVRASSQSRILLALAGEDGIIKILNVMTGSLSGHLTGHTGPVHSLLHTSNTLLSCSADSTIRLWSLLSMDCSGVLAGFSGHRDHVLCLDMHHKFPVLVSSGADATIRQWWLPDGLGSSVTGPEDPSYVFPTSPYTVFSGIHNTAVTRVRYYGDFIVSLSNNRIAVVNSNISLDELSGPEFVLDSSVPIFIGSIDTYDTCKSFEIVKHILLGINSTGDIYLFDLRDVGVEKTPFIVESKFTGAMDFAMVSEYIYVTTGQAVHRRRLDVSQFDEYL